MPTTVAIVVAIVVVVALVIVLVVAMRRRLQRRFGPEYDRWQLSGQQAQGGIRIG